MEGDEAGFGNGCPAQPNRDLGRSQVPGASLTRCTGHQRLMHLENQVPGNWPVSTQANAFLSGLDVVEHFAQLRGRWWGLIEVRGEEALEGGVCALKCGGADRLAPKGGACNDIGLRELVGNSFQQTQFSCCFLDRSVGCWLQSDPVGYRFQRGWHKREVLSGCAASVTRIGTSCPMGELRNLSTSTTVTSRLSNSHEVLGDVKFSSCHSQSCHILSRDLTSNNRVVTSVSERWPCLVHRRVRSRDSGTGSRPSGPPRRPHQGGFLVGAGPGLGQDTAVVTVTPVSSGVASTQPAPIPRKRKVSPWPSRIPRAEPHVDADHLGPEPPYGRGAHQRAAIPTDARL